MLQEDIPCMICQIRLYTTMPKMKVETCCIQTKRAIFPLQGKPTTILLPSIIIIQEILMMHIQILTATGVIIIR